MMRAWDGPLGAVTQMPLMILARAASVSKVVEEGLKRKGGEELETATKTPLPESTVMEGRGVGGSGRSWGV